MNKIIKKNHFKRIRKGAVITLSVSTLLFIALSCGKLSMVSSENGKEDPMIQQETIDWAVKLKINPQEDESYLPTEDPEIKDLLSKHGVTMTQSFPGPRSTPELLLYYDLRGSGNMSTESKENCIKDFLATEKFEDEVYEYGVVIWCSDME